jgi:hypothetical protein
MRLDLNIETFDKTLCSEILGTTHEKAGTVVAADGVTLEYQGTYFRKGVGFPDILEFVLSIPKDVAIGLFAAWLYDKLSRKKIEKITINQIMITVVTEDAIRDALEQEITFDVPVYILDLSLSWNRDHVETAKIWQPIKVLARPEGQPDAEPTAAIGVRSAEGFDVTVTTVHGTQKWHLAWELLLDGIAIERKKADRRR